ncbi:hypothetical protein PG984_006534 [Apiospora sp. TS-2023a]
MTSAVGKPEEVRTLVVHLVWDGTFRAESHQEWRQSFFALALAQQMNKLPDSKMVNLRYIQIRLQPAPIGEICQGPLSSFKKPNSILFKLPQEIRDKIYRDYFSSNSPEKIENLDSLGLRMTRSASPWLCSHAGEELSEAGDER